jgi:hypothetical protein
VRFVEHLGVAFCLLLALAQAPFSHRHAGDPFHEHAQGFVHTHWRLQHSGGPSLESEHHDSDAQMLPWLARQEESAGRLAPGVAEYRWNPVFSIQWGGAPEPPARNHSPPALLTSAPRAPPA